MTIYACYSWKEALNVGLDTSFDNKQGWKGTQKERRNVKSMKACDCPLNCNGRCSTDDLLKEQNRRTYIYVLGSERVKTRYLPEGEKTHWKTQ